MTRNTTDRYILNACVCLINLVRVSYSIFDSVFLQSAESIRGYNIFFRFSRRWKTRIGHHFCPFPHLTRSHTRACKSIFTIGFYTHCSRFMSRLFLWPLKAKEYDRATAKQPVDFIACVRFLLRLPRSQTKHLMHYSMLHLLSEKSQIIQSESSFIRK